MPTWNDSENIYAYDESVLPLLEYLAPGYDEIFCTHALSDDIEKRILEVLHNKRNKKFQDFLDKLLASMACFYANKSER